MADVETLFRAYVEEHRSGGEADPREYLARLEGVDRSELAALIDAYLQRAPARAWDPAAFAGSAAERATERIAAGWEEAQEAWQTLLPTLRDRARIKRAELVARLAAALGVEDQTAKVAAYYHQMEHGQLPSEGVSNRVLEALSTIVGESAERLRAAGSALGHGGDQRQVRESLAFARRAVSDPRYAEPEAPAQPASAEAAAAPAEAPEPDLVDELFTGGPEPGG